MHPHDNTLPGRIDCICAVCGKHFTIKRSAFLAGRGETCSRPCRSTNEAIPMIDRFWAKVQKTDGCWEWTNAKNPKGYGVFCVDKKTNNNEQAHRVSYRLHYGEIPDLLKVLHRCDNPSCVRPDHLFLGTDGDNMRDKVAKDRQHKGEKSPISKLTNAQVIEIRKRHAVGDISQSQLAREYGICHQTMGSLINGETWKHLL